MFRLPYVAPGSLVMLNPQPLPPSPPDPAQLVGIIIVGG
jgi:hypothetical protein